MIDLDINEAIFKFGRGIEVNTDTLCVDLIQEMEFCEKAAYIQTDHTLKHFRDVLWDPKIFDRTYRKGGDYPAARTDDELLAKADHAWRDLVAAQTPLEVDAKFRAELDRIVEAARKELLSQQ